MPRTGHVKKVIIKTSLRLVGGRPVVNDTVLRINVVSTCSCVYFLQSLALEKVKTLKTGFGTNVSDGLSFGLNSASK